MQLTQEEAETIGRLQQLGFPREVCLQAWVACDKIVTLPLHYRYITVTLPLRYRYITVKM